MIEMERCCPHCQSDQVVHKGFYFCQDGTRRQRSYCHSCNQQFSERTGTPLARLRKSPAHVAKVLHLRSEGLGVRATGRVEGVSHSTVARWEGRLAQKAEDWSPPAPTHSDLTVEGDELYTKVERNRPASKVLVGR